jgi:rSAM/selenodomain-associated transferase 2
VNPADIGVIIPAFNEAAALGEAIASARGAGEIIVVDGGSRDGTSEIARSHPDVQLVSTAAGRGLQLAAGAQRCTRPVLLFLHADCALAAGALDQVCRALQRHPQRGWGAMRQRIAADAVKYRWLERGNAWRIRFRGVPFGDQAMFVRRPWYQSAGGFEPIPLMEDVRLALRLRRRSWPLLVDGPVIVSPRRWQRRGVVRQTLLNLSLQAAHAAGVSPQRLSRLYR